MGKNGSNQLVSLFDGWMEWIGFFAVAQKHLTRRHNYPNECQINVLSWNFIYLQLTQVAVISADIAVPFNIVKKKKSFPLISSQAGAHTSSTDIQMKLTTGFVNWLIIN